MPVSFTAESAHEAAVPRSNSNPASLYGDSKTPSGFKTSLPVTLTCRPCGVTSSNAVVTVTDTSGIAVGDYVSGVGCSSGQAATTQDTGDTFTISSHGAPNGTPFHLTALATSTGVAINTVYYVVGTATNTFQAALTPGGAAIAITTNGTATVVFHRQVAAITTNTNVTLSVIASATAASTPLAFVGRYFDY
jgi:hypothetical protein